MAKRRMISSDVINTDAFILLSLGARGLYMHLNAEADDDGFIASAVRTTRAVGATEADLKELVDAKYLIQFDSGIYLVKHWLLHNQITKDRYTPTIHTTEKALVKEISKVYYLLSDPDCPASGSIPDPQISIEQKRSDEIKNKPRRKPAWQSIQQHNYDFESLEKNLIAN